MTSKLSKTEIALLEEAIEEARRIGKVEISIETPRRAGAALKLAERGYVTVDEISYVSTPTKRYDFGRVSRTDRIEKTALLLKAPRIEHAVKDHGAATVLAALRKRAAGTETENSLDHKDLPGLSM